VLAKPIEQEMVAKTRAMATEVTIKISSVRSERESASSDAALRAALEIFHTVEMACTRFNPASPLMRANATPTRWHRVPAVLYEALSEASAAHQRTSGRFDPRVLQDLIALGYDRTLAFATDDIVTPTRAGRQLDGHQRGPWRPRFRGASREVMLGEPVELGGIGKGLAVRWSSEVLAPHTANYMVEAGGDCYCAGVASDNGGWRVGIEDPFESDEPLAVLSLSDRAATTSSIRLRHWRAGHEVVHHLIDPRTGQPGGEGLVAVTVVGRDPAAAEVDSKVLFLAGRRDIAHAARRHGIAALWVDVNGEVESSANMKRYVLWERS
jgi:thiamine biosynthesis lipoprotein